MLQEDGAHLSFGFAVLHPVVPVVGAQSEWHRGPGGLRLSPTADPPPSRRCARRLSVPPVLSYPGVPAGGQWSLGHRGCRQVGEGSGICCLGYKALQFSLPERPKRDCTCGLRPLMHPWTIGMSATSGSRRPCPAHGPGHLTGMHMGHSSSWQRLWGAACQNLGKPQGGGAVRARELLLPAPYAQAAPGPTIPVSQMLLKTHFTLFFSPQF